MRKVWIVVANGSQSVIYKAENVKTLTEIKSFYHEESHLTRGELNSDRPGRSTQRMAYGTDTMEDKTSPKVKEAALFAGEIATFLEQEYHAGKYERLYLIAKPPFLGYLRDSLNGNVVKLIESEVQKDLIRSNPEEILDYLPPAL